jgi:hypothetical protein
VADAKLDQIEDLAVLPVQILHDVYMHCSYADARDKHAIKAPINRLVRKKLLEQGVTDIEAKPKKRAKGEKPVMLVALEWFSGAHSIWTHSASLRAAREQFRVIGVGLKDLVDDLGREVFDEFREIQGDPVTFVREQAATLRPDVVYYPAFGMFPSSIFCGQSASCASPGGFLRTPSHIELTIHRLLRAAGRLGG